MAEGVADVGTARADARGASVPSLPVAVVTCLLLAVVSLVLPIGVDYDPLAWLVWGRDVAALDLDTRGGGPAWKPLPVAINTAVAVLTPLEEPSAAAWLVVARAGGLLALVLAYRLAARLAGPVAGLVAAAVLLSTTGYLVGLLLPGMSEPLLAALVLSAVDRHLAGAPTPALLLLWCAALLRPETWPFLAGYGLLLWVREPRRRLPLVGLATLLALAWFGAEYWGSGDAFRSSQRAAVPTQGGPLLETYPGLSVLELTGRYLLAPAWLGVAVGAVAALAAVAAVAAVSGSSSRGGVSDGNGRAGGMTAPAARHCLGLLAVGLGWILVVAGMTQAGVSAGEQRYLIVGAALLAVVAGVGWAAVLAAASRWWRRLPSGEHAGTGRPVVAALAHAALILGLAAALPDLAHRVGEEQQSAALKRRETAALDNLRGAIVAQGGRSSVTSCGAVTTGRYRVPAVAWTLGLSLPEVGYDTRAPGIVLRYRGDAAGDPLVPPAFRPVPLARNAGEQWELLSSCPG